VGSQQEILSPRESEHLAERLIRETVLKEGIVRDQLTIHSDRGPSMRSQTVAQLLATLGITLLTPATVHYGQADAALAARQAVLTAAHVAHPERFVRQPPRPLALPGEVWINPPADGPEPRMLQLPRDTNFVPQLSQTG
jgi:putative transposase